MSCSIYSPVSYAFVHADHPELDFDRAVPAIFASQRDSARQCADGLANRSNRPVAALKIDAVNERQAQERGLRLKTPVALTTGQQSFAPVADRVTMLSRP